MAHGRSGRGIRLDPLEDYQGEPALRIATPAATYVYQLGGAGLASLIDPDGADWLGYRPEGGSAGHFRGLPNLIHPEGGFHPGGAYRSQTRLADKTADRAILASASEDGAWQCGWTFTEQHATVQVLAAGHPYWFLFEGTPGGALNTEEGYLLLPDGRRLALAERWEDALPEPAWVAFGDPASDYLLYLVHYEGALPVSSYRPMNGEMTVFGFGRSLADLRGRLAGVPRRFTVGFVSAAGVARREHHALVEAAVTKVLAAAG